MKAQEIIKEIEQEEKIKPRWTKEDFLRVFYNQVWRQEQASKDISFICRKVLR